MNSLGNFIWKNPQERHQNQFGRSNQPFKEISRLLAGAGNLGPSENSTCLRSKGTEIPRACVQKELRFHVPASKKTWDSMCLCPKGTEIPLRCVQSELRFYWQVPKRNWDSTCPPPKSTGTPTTHVRKRKKSSQLFGLLLVFCSFAAPEKKKGFLFPLKN